MEKRAPVALMFIDAAHDYLLFYRTYIMIIRITLENKLNDVYKLDDEIGSDGYIMVI